MKPQLGATHNMADKLAITRAVPNADDYQFLIPYYVANHERQFAPSDNKVDIVTPVDSSLSTPLLHNVAPFNPIPDMFIPYKYQDIILSDPLYADDGTFIIFGLREWFTCKYELNTREECLKKA
ncbi:hypothetical protein RhiirC2_794291 [Rhizophagus irregularis]|uniref:Uncharacterized protein n=1 Tax=Rhizophagus irregularis TaxID=588596 RepID=A0A2N1MDT7_9GLOM|nr:hypothetical protein RhiirC2_794291 [Rhizophagus irregularis]